MDWGFTELIYFLLVLQRTWPLTELNVRKWFKETTPKIWDNGIVVVVKTSLQTETFEQVRQRTSKKHRWVMKDEETVPRQLLNQSRRLKLQSNNHQHYTASTCVLMSRFWTDVYTTCVCKKLWYACMCPLIMDASLLVAPEVTRYLPLSREKKILWNLIGFDVATFDWVRRDYKLHL